MIDRSPAVSGIAHEGCAAGPCPRPVRRAATATVAVISRLLPAAAFLAAMALAARSLGGGQPAPAAADSPLVRDGLDDGRLRLSAGRSAVLTTVRPCKRVSIADPEIAAARPIGPSSVLVTGRKAGITQLILWDESESSQAIDVHVQVDAQVLREQLKALFPSASIDVASANGTIILKGRAPTVQMAEQAAQVAAPYGTRVLNLLEVSGGRQIMLHVRFAEVSRSATSSLGVNLFGADGSVVFGSNIGQISPVGAMPAFNGTLGDTPSPRGITLSDPHAISPSVTVFGAGQFGSFYVEKFVDALRRNNLLRILAEPTLLAMSGQEASFLAGGEFPIPVSGGASTGGVPTVTVEFREFGVKLNFLPTVLGDGRIRLKVSPEVSDLDFSTAVRFSGFIVPGLNQRKVSTTVELSEGQTFAIAGLLNNSVTANKDVLPLLGDLPVIGALFRSVRYQRKETELVVLVTPRLVEGMNPSQIPPLPGDQWRHPEEKDLFMRGDIGGPSGRRAPTTAPAVRTPPRYFGTFGFSPAGGHEN